MSDRASLWDPAQEAVLPFQPVPFQFKCATGRFEGKDVVVLAFRTPSSETHIYIPKENVDDIIKALQATKSGLTIADQLPPNGRINGG